MDSALLPPGFRFHPTDEELVGYYLKRKNDGLNIEFEVIPVIDLCKFDPWELPDKSFLPKRDMEWFFFCPRHLKYPNGLRSNRATASGYWKATGKDRRIACESPAFGLRKTLVFYLGRAPGGERTDWIMHEYRLCQDLLLASPDFVGDFALCRVVKRKGNLMTSGDKKCTPPPVLESGRKRSFDAAFDGAGEEGSSLGLSGCLVLPEFGREIELTMASFLEDDGFPILSSNGFPPASNQFTAHSAMNSAEEEASMFNNYQGSELWEDPTLQYLNASHRGAENFNAATVSPPTCRQASQGEEVYLWLQEDVTVTVI